MSLSERRWRSEEERRRCDWQRSSALRDMKSKMRKSTSNYCKRWTLHNVHCNIFFIFIYLFSKLAANLRDIMWWKKIYCECTALLQCRAKFFIYLCDDVCRLFWTQFLYLDERKLEKPERICMDTWWTDISVTWPWTVMTKNWDMGSVILKKNVNEDLWTHSCWNQVWKRCR